MHLQLLFQLLGVLEAQSFTGSQDHHRQMFYWLSSLCKYMFEGPVLGPTIAVKLK